MADGKCPHCPQPQRETALTWSPCWLSRSVPGLAGSSAPVLAVDPRTFGGDLWHFVVTLCRGAILPELDLGPLHRSRTPRIGNSHVGAHPFQMHLLSARCSFRMQGPPLGTAFRPLLAGRVIDVATATQRPMLSVAHYDKRWHSSLLPALTRHEPSSAPCWLALPTPGPLVCQQHHTRGGGPGPLAPKLQSFG